MAVNLQHLRYFWTVAQEGNITKACEKLYLAQPTVSGQIIQLEKAVKAKLFERRNGRLLPTGAGRMMLRYADDIFGRAQELEAALATGAASGRVRMRLGIENNISKPVMLACLGFIKTLSPEASVTVHESAFEYLLQKLDECSIDVMLHEQGGFVRKAAQYCDAVVARLPVFFVATPKWAKSVKVFPKDLAKVPLLLPIADSALRNDIDRFLSAAAVRPTVGGQLSDAASIQALALKGYGAAPVHRLSVRSELRSGKLVRLSHRPTGISKTLCLLARRQTEIQPLIQQLLDRFRLR